MSEWVYQNLTAGGTFYNRSSSSSYPLNTLQPSLYTVSTLNSQNGIGGTVTVQYSYAGAKFHRTGKGFLGFTEMVSSNITTGITTVSINELNRPSLHSRPV